MARAKKKRKNLSDDEDNFDDYSNETIRLKSGNQNTRSMEKKEISLVLAEDDQLNESQIKWSTISMGPSKFPPKYFCIICGCIGKYKCFKCYKCKPNPIIRYVCSQKCYVIHEEVDCCKPKNFFIW